MTRSSSSPKEARFIHPLGWETDDKEDEERLRLVVLCNEKKETMDKHTVHKTCPKWAPPWTLLPGGRGSYGPRKQLRQLNIQSTKPDIASSEPHPGPRTRYLGKGGVTDEKSNQSGSSEPHPGPSDPFPGGGGSYRPEKQPTWIKWAPPWTQWPVSWWRGEFQTREATKVDQVSPTLDPMTRSLGEGGVTDQKSNHSGLSEPHPGPSDPFPGGGRVTDQKSNQSGSSEPHPGPNDPFPGGGGSYRPEKQPKWIKWAPPWTQWPVPWGREETQTRKATKVEQVSPTLDPMTRSLGEGELQTRKATIVDWVSPTLDPVTRSLGEGELQTRKATKVDQVSPTLDPMTRSLGEGGVTDQRSNQSGSSEPHPGPNDPFPGGGGSYRPEKQPKWIKWAPPWTQWPVPWGRGELQTRKATKVDQVSPTLDPMTRSLGEGGDTDQRSNQSGSSEPHPGPNDPFPGGGGSYRPEKQP